MCGRYTLAGPDPAALCARFPLGERVEIRRRFNVCPGDDVLAVTTDREGTPRGETLRWGLVPHWAQDPKIGMRMINARLETLASKAAFRDARRCLVVADGFYEWERLDGGGKQPYRVTRADGAPFAFAGLWSSWRGELRSCSIVTTAALRSIERIHDRMPVILTRDGEADWLAGGAPLEVIDGELKLTPVGPAVNDARYDGPECIAEVAPARPPATLF
jgi:putative SOS response-associated peptidase YedK